MLGQSLTRATTGRGCFLPYFLPFGSGAPANPGHFCSRAPFATGRVLVSLEGCQQAGTRLLRVIYYDFDTYNPLMAQTRVIEILDDVDGTSNAVPHQLSLDGITYDIDLSAENFTKLMSGLSPFIAAARKTKSSTTGRGNQQAARRANRDELAKIREWAIANGHQVAPRGRVAQPIVEAYAAANS